MANNKSVTNPNQIRAANWQKAAKAILNDNIGLYIYRVRDSGELDELNPYEWLPDAESSLYFSAESFEIQALFCLFIAEFILTDGDLDNAV